MDWTSTLTQQQDTTAGYSGNNTYDGYGVGDFRVTVDLMTDRTGLLYECFLIDGETATLVSSTTVAIQASGTWNTVASARVTGPNSLVTIINRWGGGYGYVGLTVAADGTLSAYPYVELGIIAGVAANRFCTVRVTEPDAARLHLAAWNSTSEVTWHSLTNGGHVLPVEATATLPSTERPTLRQTIGGYAITTDARTNPTRNVVTVRDGLTGAVVAEHQYEDPSGTPAYTQSFDAFALMPDARLVVAFTRTEGSSSLRQIKLVYQLFTIGAGTVTAAAPVTVLDYPEGGWPTWDTPYWQGIQPLADRLLAYWFDYGNPNLGHLAIIDPALGVLEYDLPVPTGVPDASHFASARVMGDDKVWLDTFNPVTDWLYTLTPILPEIITGPRATRSRFWQ